MAKQSEEETQRKIREERDRRLKLEKIEREAAANRNGVSSYIYGVLYFNFFVLF